jgi:monofunctional glycosyltransferase
LAKGGSNGGKVVAWLRRVLRYALIALIVLHAFWGVALLGLRYINPFTTMVQLQRRAEAWLTWSPYDKYATFVPLKRMSPHAIHAVIAAEDGRFYQHAGIDWRQVELVIEETFDEGGSPRGASTLTQQLVKNLFFTTHRNPLRKVFEYTLAPMATLILGRDRVLELYLNVAEWGPGIFGIEAAAAHHYKSSAARLTREQAARLAACLPAPRRRRPASMSRYANTIQTRMHQMGW